MKEVTIVLYLRNFDVIDDSLHYIGDNEYIIAPNYPVTKSTTAIL